MKAPWIIAGLAGAVILMATGWTVVRRGQGDALRLEAERLLRASVGDIPRHQDLEAARALDLLEQAKRLGASGVHEDALQREASLLVALAKGDLVEAERLVFGIQSRGTWTAELRWLAAETAHLKGERDKALAQLESVLRSRPEFSRARLLRADMALDRGEGEVAVRDLALVIAKNQHCASLHNRMALAHELRGDERLEEFHLRRAVALDARSVDARVNLGRMLSRSGRFEESYESFNEAVSLAPAAPDALLGRGLACERWADCIGNAKQDFLRAQELLPSDATPLVALGDWHLRREELSDAIDLYQRAVRVTGSDAVAWLKLGNALFRRQNLEGAEAAFRTAVRVDPTFAAAHNGLGAALVALGKPNEAVPILERAADLDPEDPNPQRNLAVALAKAG